MARLRRKTSSLFKISDILVIAAWLSFLVQASLDTVLWKIHYLEPDNGVWQLNANSTTTALALKILFVEKLLYQNTMYCVKIAMLQVYYDFFPIRMRKRRIAITVVLWIVIIAWIVHFLTTLLSCFPISREWSLDGSEQCSENVLVRTLMIQTVPNVVTDILGKMILCIKSKSNYLVYVLPIPVITQLELSPRLTISLLITFGCGLACIMFAIAGTLTAYFSSSITIPWMFCIFEQTYAILVTCFPTLNAFCFGSRPMKLAWKGQEIITQINEEHDSSDGGSKFDVFNREISVH